MNFQNLPSKILGLLVALSVVGYSNAQTTITLQPNGLQGKDAKIWDLNPNTNYGDDIHFAAWAWTWGGTPGAARGLMDFDLSPIPPNTTIDDARLSLYYAFSSSEGQDGTNETYIRRITSPWSEFGVTWNNQPITTTQNQVHLPSSTFEDQDYPDIDVTDLVQDMIDDTSNSHGIMIQLVTEVEFRSMKFASSDYANAARHPKLEITYTVVGVQENNDPDDVKIYPNPFSDQLNVNIPYSVHGEVQLRVLDGLGRMIYNTNRSVAGSSNIFNLSPFSTDYPSGMYFLEIITSRGTNTYKLLKQ